MEDAKNISVFFVEDNPDDIELFILEFENHNYKVNYEYICDVQNIEYILNEKKFDVIIVDYFLPGLNVKDILKNLVTISDTPVFVTSNVVEEQIFEQLYKLGVRDFIHKSRIHRLVPSIEKELTRIEHQKEIEELKKKAKANEEQYKLFSELTLEGIVIHDNLKTIDTNTAFLKITGFNREELVGESLLKLVPEKNDQVKIKEKVKGGSDKPYTVKLQHKNGQTFFAELEGRVEKYGETLYRIVAVRNINKRMIALKEKEESERKYTQLVNQLQEGMGIVDLNETIQFTNPAFDAIFGYATGSLIGKNVKDFLVEDDHAFITQETHKRIEGKSDDYKLKIKTKNGQSKIIRVSANPWYNNSGEIAGTMALIIDVTSQVNAKRDLERRYAFEKSLFNISKRFLTYENFDDNFNKSLKELGKLSDAERVMYVKLKDDKNIGKATHEWVAENISSQNENSDEVFLKNIQWGLHKLKEREPFYIKNIEDLPDDASALKNEMVNRNIFNFLGFPAFHGKRISGFVGIVNFTGGADWNSNEFILLRTVGEELTNALQRRYAELEITKLNNDLIEKNKELEQVLYVTSHDIRSPLVNIMGFSKELNKAVEELEELIKKDEYTNEDKKNIEFIINQDIPEVLNFIDAGGRKIDSQLKALLKLSRLGRSEITREELDTNKLIAEIIESLEFQLESYQIEFIVQNLHSCHSDKQILTQVFSNLIDNAIKYNSSERKSYIKVHSKLKKDTVQYFFEDNGLGIPNDKKQQIFDIFSRWHHSKAEGEGMGLTIIKKGLERLGGNIFVESEEDKGSTFIVELPLTKNQV